MKKNLNFLEALDHLSSGYFIKLPEWGGYWEALDDGLTAVTTRGGEVGHAPYIWYYHRRTDWIAFLEEGTDAVLGRERG